MNEFGCLPTKSIIENVNLKIVKVRSRKDDGKFSSMDSISLLNLFTILPIKRENKITKF